MHLSSVSPKLWFWYRRIVVLCLPASHLPCNTNMNGEYGEWRSSSKPAFWMTASVWADVWSDALSWLQVTSVCFLNLKNSWKDTKFLTLRTLSARQMSGWKTKYNNSSTAESELWRNAGQSAFQLQESLLKSDKIWCAYIVANSVRLQTFWMPLIIRKYKMYLFNDGDLAEVSGGTTLNEWDIGSQTHPIHVVPCRCLTTHSN